MYVSYLSYLVFRLTTLYYLMPSLSAETEGSVLYPAAQNNVVGFRASVGLVSRAGIIPVNLDQDTIGIMAKSIHDACLDVIAGEFEFESENGGTSIYMIEK
jgi:Asp-tRNA(Asn)/Glu-tRNA(Gln) amidotransferase A subunit family amidase